MAITAQDINWNLATPMPMETYARSLGQPMPVLGIPALGAPATGAPLGTVPAMGGPAPIQVAPIAAATTATPGAGIGLGVGGRTALGAGGTVAPGLGTGLDWNIGTGQLAVQGLGTLSNMWTASQAQALAKKQFDFSSRIANTNLANQIRSYNTTLGDRTRVRNIFEGRPQSETDEYMNQHRARLG